MKNNKKTLLMIGSLVLALSSTLLFGCSNKPNNNSVPTIDTISSLFNKYNCITLSEAIRLSGTTKDQYTSEKYYIAGKIKQINNPTWGNLVITDGTNDYEIYGSYNEDGTIRYDAMVNVPVVGDYVIYYGYLGYFNAPQMKDGWIKEYYHEVPSVDDTYVSKKVSEARDAKEGDHIIVEGVVAQITYANGLVPNGFFVCDNTSSIYVYGKNATAQVKVGNKVKIAGTKTYYVLDTEKDNAIKFGYKGCCQIDEATILENDKGNNNVDLSWAQSKTVKEIMNVPFSNDGTTLIYKTNALIKKAPGDGFVNYYIDDLDGVTGSYAYTQCNGSDYSWLDEYDNKVCTLYVTAINAKASPSGCVYRLVPIKVESDNYKFDLSNTHDFVFEYYVKDLIKSNYVANPDLELPSKVDNDIIDIKNVNISYSSTSDIFSFTSSEDKVVMGFNKEGSGEIKVSVSYNNVTKDYKVATTFALKVETPSHNVKYAIDAQDEEEVVIKGVIASGIANQVGFYLIDETGVIAVKTDSETLKTVSIGNLVVVKGTKTHFGKTSTTAGQACILDATIEDNLFGEHEYSTASFKSDLTVKEMVELSVLEDYSTNVYVVTGKLIVYKSNYSTNYEILDADGKTYIQFYAGSGSQYEWLDPYLDTEVTIELALCNWNKKTKYTGCVIAVRDGDHKVYNPGKF